MAKATGRGWSRLIGLTPPSPRPPAAYLLPAPASGATRARVTMA